MIRVNPRFAIVGVAVMAAISLLFGIPLAVGGNFLVAKYFLLFALMMALVIALGVTTRANRKGRPLTAKTTEDHGAPHGTVPATRLRYARRELFLMLALTSSSALFCLLAAVEIYLNLDDDDFPGVSIAVGAVGLFFASYVIAALGRMRGGELLLSIQGVTHRGWCFESRLDWSGIRGSTPFDHEGQHIVLFAHYNADWRHRYTTTRLWRTELLPPIPMISLDYSCFDADPRALYAFLSYYVDTPAARHELGTEAALTRAREMNLPH